MPRAIKPDASVWTTQSQKYLDGLNSGELERNVTRVEILNWFAKRKLPELRAMQSAYLEMKKTKTNK